MKTKIITTLGIAIIGLGLSANIAFAQEAPATLTLQQQYQETLVTLIGLLQQQVQSLLTQLQAINTKIDTIQSAPLPVFSSTQINMQDLTVKILRQPLEDNPNVSFYMELKDAEGKTIERPVIHITSTKDGQSFRDDTTQGNNFFGSFSQTLDNVFGVQYNPLLEKGTYEFTFSANGMTKTEEIAFQ